MLSKFRFVPLKVAVGASSALVLMSVGGTVSAAPACSASDFTSNGVFDTDGYLACLAGASGGAGGLPATGSDTTRLFVVAAGLCVVGVGSVIASKRRQSESVPDGLGV
jgi:LPXTG-motif cell wall-anchored protein